MTDDRVLTCFYVFSVYYLLTSTVNVTTTSKEDILALAGYQAVSFKQAMMEFNIIGEHEYFFMLNGEKREINV